MAEYTRVEETKVGNNTVRIHHPERTAEEQLRYEAERNRALQRFGREMVKVGLL